MNGPAENRRKVREGSNAPDSKRDEAWAKLNDNSLDQLYAEAQGLKAKMGTSDGSIVRANKKEF